MSHDLATTVARRPDDDLGGDPVGKLGDGVRPCRRPVHLYPRMFGTMQGPHAIGRKNPRGRGSIGTDGNGLEWLPQLTRKASRHGEHLEGQHGRRSGDVLDKRQDHAQSNRKCWKSSTTCTPASPFFPRISTVWAACTGSLSRIFSSPPSCQSGVFRSISFFFAFSRPGSEGYRGRLIPSFTVSTAGSGTSAVSQPDSVWRGTVHRPAVIPHALMPVTHGRSSASATRTPTWYPALSADSFPNITRSYARPAARSASIASAIAEAVAMGSQSRPSV